MQIILSFVLNMATLEDIVGATSEMGFLASGGISD